MFHAGTEPVPGYSRKAFNLSNTAQFGLPGTNYSGGTPGMITSVAGDARIMQFALRFKF